MIKCRCLKSLLYKLKKKLRNEGSTSGTKKKGCWWVKFKGEEEVIPGDVPKGHLVVYVGEEWKRFVIRVSFLEHPLFRALLDRAREEYEYSPDMRLCIPCEEKMFLNILRCVTGQQKQRICLKF